jgi:hypothetical protein
LQGSFLKTSATPLVKKPRHKELKALAAKQAIQKTKLDIDERFPNQAVSMQEGNRILDEEQAHRDDLQRAKREKERKIFYYQDKDYVENARVSVYVAPNTIPAPPAPTWEELRAQYLADEKANKEKGIE